MRKTKAHVTIRLLRFFFASIFFSAGAAVVEGQDRLLVRCQPLGQVHHSSVPDEALHVDTGQKGLTLPPTALMRALILSSVTVRLLSHRMVTECMQANCGRRPCCGRLLGGCFWPCSSHQMKWGPYPIAVLASLEGWGTLAAAEESAKIILETFFITLKIL